MQAHWDGLAAADLFTVEVLTLAGLRRYLVFFVIELQTRRVHIGGIHPQPSGPRMEQLARNLTGSFYNAEVGVRAARRNPGPPGYRDSSIGFRVVVSTFSSGR